MNRYNDCICGGVMIIFFDILTDEDESRMVELGSGEKAVYLPKYNKDTGSIYWGGFCSNTATIPFSSFKELKENIEKIFTDRICAIVEVDF